MSLHGATIELANKEAQGAQIDPIQDCREHKVQVKSQNVTADQFAFPLENR